jgi:hypothetical protein
LEIRGRLFTAAHRESDTGNVYKQTTPASNPALEEAARILTAVRESVNSGALALPANGVLALPHTLAPSEKDVSSKLYSLVRASRRECLEQDFDRMKALNEWRREREQQDHELPIIWRDVGKPGWWQPCPPSEDRAHATIFDFSNNSTRLPGSLYRIQFTMSQAPHFLHEVVSSKVSVVVLRCFWGALIVSVGVSPQASMPNLASVGRWPVIISSAKAGGRRLSSNQKARVLCDMW